MNKLRLIHFHQVLLPFPYEGKFYDYYDESQPALDRFSSSNYVQEWSLMNFFLNFRFATLRKIAEQIVLTSFAGVSARKRWNLDCLRDFRYI